MYNIKTDITAGMIEVEIAGFWTEGELATFAADLRRAAATIAATGKSHLLLCDYSAAAIQSQDVIAGFQALVLTIPHKARKVAAYTTGPFARMQAKRVSSVRENMAVFDDRAGALEWLLADELDRSVRTA